MRMPQLILLLCLLAGCSTPQVNTTRLGSADAIAMTDRMVESLLRSGAAADRTAQSEPWTVSLDRVSNKTNQVLPQRELWGFMARLRAQLAASPAMRERNIRFVLPPEFAGESERDAEFSRLTPTHSLTATFYSLTAATLTARSDTHLCAFQLVELPTGGIVWEDRYEVKRAVERNKLD